MKPCIVYLHAITPVHSGTGHTVAVIDLPVAREKATGWPMIPGSSIKGVMRDVYPADEATKNGIFGTQDKAGPLVLTDQRILCLPVRSFFGTYAYATCPLVLRRFKQDFQALGASVPFADEPPTIPGQDACAVAQGAVIVNNGKVYLEDLDLNAQSDDTTTKIAEALAQALFQSQQDQTAFIQRFAIVSDELFTFLSENGTEIAARIKLDDKTGTTSGQEGNLWYEEAVPSETVFAGAALCTNGQDPAAVLQPLANKYIQVGGNASVGRGLCRVIVK